MANRKSKRPVQVNWNFGEETENEIRLSEPVDPDRSDRARLRWIWGGILLILLLAGAGVILLSISAQRAQEAERLAMLSAIQERVDLEAWAWADAAWPTLAALVDPDARREWARWHTQYSEGLHYWAREYAQRPLVRVEAVDLLADDLAEVRVRIVQAEVPETVPHTETRYYRRVDGIWMRTSPMPERWGDSTILRTARFDFEYPVADTASVDAVATVIDGVLNDMRRRLGIQPSSPPGRLIVQIVPDNFAAHVDVFVGRRLILLSPRLTRIPEGWSEARALTAAVIDPLSRFVLDEAVAPAQIHPSWHVMFLGVQKWLATTVNPFEGEAGRSTAPLDRYMAQNGPPSLESLHAARDPNSTWASGWVILAAESAVTYGLSTYGSDKVADLVAGFVRYDSWDELIPAVFGVSVAEFEAGWQAWIVERGA